jgi:uncharacterized protein (DUF1697 family)
MAIVAFLRAVNLGGRTLRTKQLADELGIVNVAAAGTFVAPGARSPAPLVSAIRKKLPFETEIFTCTGPEILALLEESPFATLRPAEAQRFVSFLGRGPARPPLPVDRPEGKAWEVRIVTVIGSCALSLRRPGDLYPNAVVEKVLGVAATTRGWATLEAVGKVLRERAVR